MFQLKQREKICPCSAFMLYSGPQRIGWRPPSSEGDLLYSVCWLRCQSLPETLSQSHPEIMLYQLFGQHLAQSSWPIKLLITALSRLEPWRVQKRRKRRFLLCQKRLRKSERISQNWRSRAWERSLPKRGFERQGGSLSMKKLSITTRNTGRCTELKFEWLGWHKKLATSMYPRNPNWHLSSGSEVSTVWAQRFERCCSSFASSRSSTAPLWSSTRHQLTCWELWSHTLHGGTQIRSL